MADLWFVRHGESLSNAGERTYDTASTRLSARGYEQASICARDFPITPDLIIMTPYARTQLTAAPLRKRFPAIPTAVWPLHEFSYLSASKYAGTTAAERSPDVARYWKNADPDYRDGDSTESFNDVLRRIDALPQLVAASGAQKIVIFCHGLILQIMALRQMHPAATPTELMQMFVDFRHSHTVANTQIIRATATADHVTLNLSDLPRVKPDAPRGPSP